MAAAGMKIFFKLIPTIRIAMPQARMTRSISVTGAQTMQIVGQTVNEMGFRMRGAFETTRSCAGPTKVIKSITQFDFFGCCEIITEVTNGAFFLF
jgi:hypothetical protein